MEANPELTAQWPLLVYFALVVGLVITILAVSHLLGQRHQGRATGEPFESGVVHVGDVHIRFSAPYFLIAMLFVIFDLEAVFIYAWAVSFRETGWPGYIEISIFILILLAALFYLWRLGALEWGPQGRAAQRQPPQQGKSRVLAGEAPPVRAPQP